MIGDDPFLSPNRNPSPMHNPNTNCRLTLPQPLHPLSYILAKKVDHYTTTAHPDHSICMQLYVLNFLPVTASYYRFLPFFPLPWQKYFWPRQKPNSGSNTANSQLVQKTQFSTNIQSNTHGQTSTHVHNGCMTVGTFRQEQFLVVQLTVWLTIILVKYVGSQLSLAICADKVLDMPYQVEGQQNLQNHHRRL